MSKSIWLMMIGKSSWKSSHMYNVHIWDRAGLGLFWTVVNEGQAMQTEGKLSATTTGILNIFLEWTNKKWILSLLFCNNGNNKTATNIRHKKTTRRGSKCSLSCTKVIFFMAVLSCLIKTLSFFSCLKDSTESVFLFLFLLFSSTQMLLDLPFSSQVLESTIVFRLSLFLFILLFVTRTPTRPGPCIGHAASLFWYSTPVSGSTKGTASQRILSHLPPWVIVPMEEKTHGDSSCKAAGCMCSSFSRLGN